MRSVQTLLLLMGSSLPLFGLLACGSPESSGDNIHAAGSTEQSLLRGTTDDAVWCADRDVPPRYRAFARAFDEERQALGASGSAVAILEHGRVTFAHGFGTRGPGSAEPAQATTLFRIGSMTKALTATALLSLVDQRALGLDSKLKEIVPDIAISGPELSDLTVRQLLSHQSGLFDYGTLDGPRDDAGLSSFATSDTFRAAEYFMDPPGTFWNYSNPNFILAGLAAERVSGVSYREFMAARVFEPLHMERTFFLASDVLADGDYAVGRSTDEGGSPVEMAPDSYENAFMRPAGYAFSSVLDYAKFVRALYTGRPQVLSPRLRAAMQHMEVPTLYFGSEQGYGFGLLVAKGFSLGTSYYPTVMVSHGGDINGFAADFYLLPASGFGIVILANADGAHFQSSLALALRSFGALPEPSALPADVAVDPSTFPGLAGTYFDPHYLGAVAVNVSDGVVRLSVPGLDAAGIPYDPVATPFTADNFIVNVGPPYGQQVVTFIRGESGTYTWLRTRIAVGKRQPLPATFPAPQVGAAGLRERLRSSTHEPLLPGPIMHRD